MRFSCQLAAVEQLKLLAAADRHSVLVEGPSGCGKTYLAMQYAQMLGVPDFQVIEPKVEAVREAIDGCLQVGNPVVLCIENLDRGVAAASYTILKFLEEPASNIYIVVTCRNMNRVPDTIISRSVQVNCAPPIETDIDAYAQSKDFNKYSSLCATILWKCVRTFGDAEQVMRMTDAQLQYFNDLVHIVKFRDPISTTSWELQHYKDNTETPIELVIRYIMEICTSDTIRKAGITCLSDINAGRIASHAAVARFVLECKYVD